MKRSIIKLHIGSFIPFFVFIAGYYCAALWWGGTAVHVPHIVGTPAHTALDLLSNHHLYPYVIGHQENLYVDEGTVIEQIPQPHTSVKPHQTVFLVLAKRPQYQRMPHFVGKSIAEVRKQAYQCHIPLREYGIASTYPVGHVIAQIPAPDTEYDCHHAVVYVAQRSETHYMLPDCAGHDVYDVVQLCKMHHIPLRIFTRDGACISDNIIPGTYTVSYQRPMSGTIIDIDNPPLLYVVVSHE